MQPGFIARLLFACHKPSDTIPNASASECSAALFPLSNRDPGYWRAGVCPADALASGRDRANRHQPYNPQAVSPLAKRIPDAHNPAQGIQRICAMQQYIQVDRRLPYALHRPNGTVPAAWIAAKAPNAAGALHEGRLLGFPSTQAVASVTSPWDPGRKSGAMVRRRPAGCHRSPKQPETPLETPPKKPQMVFINSK